MRYLNKIIFIESANIRYAEVKLDGNVHLIGTQGVGKSTLLRALLFFYNANQLKLGIPIEKKRFADFYFPYQNSFIVYELANENGALSVLAYKSQGRIVFRFFDAAYQQSFFINESDGRIAQSWDEVRDNLGRNKVKYTRLIDRYEEYRNIIYGNNKSLSPEFRKYALLESKQFQNIPRAIQHVFLNYKVESDFIKDTIIKSLNEEEIPIDLSTYTLHLKDFETQLKDIRIWTDKPSKGENIVKKLAENIAKTYSTIRFIEQDFLILSDELMSKLKENEHEQIKYNASRDKEKEKLDTILHRQKTRQDTFEEDKRKLSEDRGVFVNKLKEAKAKSLEYERINILEILNRVATKNEILQEQQNLLNQKTLLETNFNDIKQRYEIHIAQQTNSLEAYRNSLQEKSQQLDKAFWEDKETLTLEYEEIFTNIRKEFEDKTLQSIHQINERKDERSKLNNKLFEAKHLVYYELEIKTSKVKIQNAKTKIQEIANDIARIENESTSLKTQWELKKQSIETDIARQKEDNKKNLLSISSAISVIQQRIENSKDSLYGWLNKEYPNWENTIGKVIDENNVLFNPNLSPKKVDTNSNAFYGVQLDLQEIDKKVKTVADYEKEIIALEKEIEKLKASDNNLESILSEQLDALKKKYQPRIKKIKEEIEKYNYDIEQQKRSIESEDVTLGNLQRKAETDKNKKIETILSQIDSVSLDINAKENELEGIKNQIDKKIKAKQKEKESKIEQKRLLTETSKDKIKTSIAERNAQIEAEIKSIKDLQTQELEAKGADTKKIAQLEEKLNLLGSELRYIEDNTEVTFNYRKDEKEFFSKVDFFKSQRDMLDEKLKNLSTKNDILLNKLAKEEEEIKIKLHQYQTLLDSIEVDHKKFTDFQTTDAYKSNSQLFYDRSEKLSSTKSGVKIIEEFIEKYYSRIREINTLRERITKFNGNFSENNIFKFKLKLIEEYEYLQFAEDLQEFIHEDKISEFEKRVNELFANIIKQVGRETEQLLSKENAIQKVINDINNDFVKRNFAGVIKSIQLRKIPSSNKIVQILGEIKIFNDENIFNLGEMNLFTASEQNREDSNRQAVQYLSALGKAIVEYKASAISLSDSFELEFKVIENDNDTGWVDKLANVGSDGTDVLVKAMINIMLLNVFKEGATKNKFKDFKLHCMMDEIGKLHPNNVRGILKFANDRNIFLINGSPQSFDALAYKYTYKLSKQKDTQIGKEITVINRIVTNNRI